MWRKHFRKKNRLLYLVHRWCSWRFKHSNLFDFIETKFKINVNVNWWWLALNFTFDLEISWLIIKKCSVFCCNHSFLHKMCDVILLLCGSIHHRSINYHHHHHRRRHYYWHWRLREKMWNFSTLSEHRKTWSYPHENQKSQFKCWKTEDPVTQPESVSSTK